MTHIRREEARAIPNEQRWIRSAQRHCRRIVRILGIEHEKELYGWVQMLVKKLHHSREHIAQAMAEKSRPDTSCRCSSLDMGKPSRYQLRAYPQ
jgi:hypothetical protein